jgi:hypothetical protein
MAIDPTEPIVGSEQKTEFYFRNAYDKKSHKIALSLLSGFFTLSNLVFWSLRAGEPATPT